MVLLVLYGREKKEEIEVGVGNLKGCLKGYIDGYSKGYCKSYFKQYLKINWHILKTKAKIDFIHFLCKFYFISFLYEHLSFLTCFNFFGIFFTKWSSSNFQIYTLQTIIQKTSNFVFNFTLISSTRYSERVFTQENYKGNRKA